ncbi:hypothetical protein [Klebsiella pneumoniae]|uniref:hypothetical protein n=1 Tax=Klebsiella pneumoniae TaxID=573 RepID=UPI0039BB6CFA|nr:hypothetical protein [Klebsiella pneumoniae]
MSILTKEGIQKILNDDWLLMDDCEGLENCTVIKELARMALATMDSDPVGWTDEQELRDVEKDGCGYLFKANPITLHADPRRVILLYRHAQPVPVVSTDLLHTAASAIEDLLTTKDRAGAGVWFDLPFMLRSAANAQAAPVVPDERDKAVDAEDHPLLWSFNEGWNACRAAMLAAAPQEVKGE